MTTARIYHTKLTDPDPAMETVMGRPFPLRGRGR